MVESQVYFESSFFNTGPWDIQGVLFAQFIFNCYLVFRHFFIQKIKCSLLFDIETEILSPPPARPPPV